MSPEPGARRLQQLPQPSNPTQTIEPEPTNDPTPTPVPTITPAKFSARSFGGWLAGLMVLIGLIILFYQMGVHWISVRWGVRFALLTALMGSFGLVIYGLTPIGKPFPEIWNAIIFSGAGGLIGSLPGLDLVFVSHAGLSEKT